MKIEVINIKKNNKIFNFIKRYKTQILITFLFVIITYFFVTNSSHYINVFIEGMLLYGTKVLPSLLPFLFITKILSNFDFIFYVCSKFKFLSKFLFNTPQISFYIFFMSIISGYPIGAKLTSEFYEKGLITNEDAQKILSYCSTSGPLFVIGSVGVGFFASSFFGTLLFLSHIVSSVINGILFGYIKTKKSTQTLLNQQQKIQKNDPTKDFKNFSLDDIMYNSIRSVLIVGGFIIIFYVFIQIMLDNNFLLPLTKLFEFVGLSGVESEGFCAGLFEITTGVNILSKSNNIQLSFVLSSFLISFSGVSILMQSFTFLNKTKINKKMLIFQKFCHATISALIAYFLSFLLI